MAAVLPSSEQIDGFFFRPISRIDNSNGRLGTVNFYVAIKAQGLPVSHIKAKFREESPWEHMVSVEPIVASASCARPLVAGNHSPPPLLILSHGVGTTRNSPHQFSAVDTPFAGGQAPEPVEASLTAEGPFRATDGTCYSGRSKAGHALNAFAAVVLPGSPWAVFGPANPTISGAVQAYPSRCLSTHYGRERVVIHTPPPEGVSAFPAARNQIAPTIDLYPAYWAQMAFSAKVSSENSSFMGYSTFGADYDPWGKPEVDSHGFDSATSQRTGQRVW